MASEGWTEFLRSHEAAPWSTRLLGPGVNAGAAGLTPSMSETPWSRQAVRFSSQ